MEAALMLSSLGSMVTAWAYFNLDVAREKNAAAHEFIPAQDPTERSDFIKQTVQKQKDADDAAAAEEEGDQHKYIENLAKRASVVENARKSFFDVSRMSTASRPQPPRPVEIDEKKCSRLIKERHSLFPSSAVRKADLERELNASNCIRFVDITSRAKECLKLTKDRAKLRASPESPLNAAKIDAISSRMESALRKCDGLTQLILDEEMRRKKCEKLDNKLYQGVKRLKQLARIRPYDLNKYWDFKRAFMHCDNLSATPSSTSSSSTSSSWVASLMKKYENLRTKPKPKVPIVLSEHNPKVPIVLSEPKHSHPQSKSQSPQPRSKSPQPPQPPQSHAQAQEAILDIVATTASSMIGVIVGLVQEAAKTNTQKGGHQRRLRKHERSETAHALLHDSGLMDTLRGIKVLLATYT